jgi:hypothetical protein
LSDIILTVFSFAVVLGSLTTMIGAAVGASGRSTEAWVDEARAAYTASLGDIRAISATAQESAGTTVIDLTVENTGNAAFAAWDEWDVTVQYAATGGTTSIQRLAYATSLATGKWTVDGIYVDAVTRAEEGVEPETFNPTEQMVVRLQVSPVAATGQAGMVVITTRDGLSTRIHFDP